MKRRTSKGKKKTLETIWEKKKKQAKKVRNQGIDKER